MLFSNAYHIERSEEDYWFDPILDADTPLFIDPFLIFQDAAELWRAAHEELIGHFNTCFELIAKGRRNRDSVPYRKALALLTFPEPQEFCLGYTRSGTDGAGGGKGYAQLIAEAMEDAIERGLTDLRHFEELGILNEGIGPDRISDVTCNILRRRFIAYTKQIVGCHHIPTQRVNVQGASLNTVRMNWQAEPHYLPVNEFSEKPILLLPKRFLSDLPTLNPKEWWYSYDAQQLRDDMNYTILTRVSKHDIVELARENPESVRAWTRSQEEKAGESYNLEVDPRGVYQYDQATRIYTSQNPLAIDTPSTNEQFFEVIALIIEEFKEYVEEQGGWSLLWNEVSNKEKREEAAQRLFMGFARSYCRANNIVVDREVELGRGPVDFKFSNGYSRRALLEIKKLDNSRFWNGIQAQLPSYLKSDQVRDGWFVVIQYKDSKNARQRIQELPGVVNSVAVRSGKALRYIVVDAAPKTSASKINE
ncbi:hypothetical protein [Glycomyces xiaoerkulensis]|uniref:hypothetical protein n=1 Tax=Glycomyces xiaoerkulensis TaxID=2038139 RepID=UPI00130010B0|nr:hypothetical protein [Glycomyces xiaoerkulensis]